MEQHGDPQISKTHNNRLKDDRGDPKKPEQAHGPGYRRCDEREKERGQDVSDLLGERIADHALVWERIDERAHHAREHIADDDGLDGAEHKRSGAKNRKPHEVLYDLELEEEVGAAHAVEDL